MDQYWLYRSVNSPTSFNFHSIIIHPETTFADTSQIAAGNLYIYCLMAVDTAGNQSEFSDSVQVGIPKIDWSLFALNNYDTAYVALDSVLSDPDDPFEVLVPVVSNMRNVRVENVNDQLIIMPDPPGYYGNGSFSLAVFDPEGFSDSLNINLEIIQTAPTDINALNNTTPVNYELFQNYPNPFNPTTQFQFSVPETETVNLILFNTLGEKVETVFSERMNPGTYTLDYDAKHLSSGVYLLYMETRNYRDVIKIILLK